MLNNIWKLAKYQTNQEIRAKSPVSQEMIKMEILFNLI